MTTLKGEDIDYSGTPLNKGGLVASVGVDHKALMERLPNWDPDKHWGTQTKPLLVWSGWSGRNQACTTSSSWDTKRLPIRWTGVTAAWAAKREPMWLLTDTAMADTVYLNTHLETCRHTCSLEKQYIMHIQYTQTHMYTEHWTMVIPSPSEDSQLALMWNVKLKSTMLKKKTMVCPIFMKDKYKKKA